jgi:hypothetical protein
LDNRFTLFNRIYGVCRIALWGTIFTWDEERGMRIKRNLFLGHKGEGNSLEKVWICVLDGIG